MSSAQCAGIDQVPLFALVDCNNFYASCERVFNPAIRRKPVVVLSNNDGCVIARSNEAKALGFKMGALISRCGRRSSGTASPCFRAITRSTATCGTDHRNGVSFDQQDGSAVVGCRVRRDRRVRRRRSARCEKRGVKSNQEFGVTKLGTDGPARRSRLLSSAWWTGPPPIPRRGPPRATNRMTRPPRRSPPQEAARGFWIRAWGQRGSALQGTGRSNDPARWLGLLRGWAGRSPPLTPKPTDFASNTRSER